MDQMDTCVLHKWETISEYAYSPVSKLDGKENIQGKEGVEHCGS